MKFLLLLLASVCISLAWLLPVHYRPWVTYTGELYAFLAVFALAAIYLKDRISIPRITNPLLLISLIPLVQWGVGKIFFFDKALLSFLFVFAFWLCIVLGYNLTLSKTEREQIFSGLSGVFILCGTLTGLIAISQWLTIDAYIPGMVDMKNAARPYANFAQPNNMASFLVMSLLAGLYLYEKQKLKTWVIAACTLIMLFAVALSQSRTSWVACICVLIYAAWQQYKGYITLKWYYSLSWLALFIVFTLSIPVLTQTIVQFTDVNIAQTKGVVARAAVDMSRLAIWDQMLHAIQNKPWSGYGWHQTSVAYMQISDSFPGPLWIRSAHNIVIDLLLWNGLLLGVPILMYFIWWGVQLSRQVNSVESVIGLLMIGALMVHGLLEFPLMYAYFLLPMGFILGIVQSQNTQCSQFSLSPRFMQITFVIGLILLALIYRDYKTLVPKLNQSIRYDGQPAKLTNQDEIYILQEFDRRIDWIRMNPYTQVSREQLDELKGMVENYPTKYDVIKYAKLLAYNGYPEEAKHQLWLLKQMKKVDVKYEQLLPASSVKQTD